MQTTLVLLKPEETELAVPPLAARGQVEGLSTHPLGATSSLTENNDTCSQHIPLLDAMCSLTKNKNT